MVELPEGRMKSREGTVVDADDLISETQGLARAEVVERYQITPEAADERSRKIALAAIKYQVLKVDIVKNMVFDPGKAIAFEGDTGPYLLYSYARASSILRKTAASPSLAVGDLDPAEVRLAKKIALFPETAAHAAARLSPAIIAGYAFELAQGFNEFYHACQVIGSGEHEGIRISLVTSFRATLGKCLWLLGIEEVDEM
jgi:arginyl-tRNA synthetase